MAGLSDRNRMRTTNARDKISQTGGHAPLGGFRLHALGAESLVHACFSMSVKLASGGRKMGHYDARHCLTAEARAVLLGRFGLHEQETTRPRIQEHDFTSRGRNIALRKPTAYSAAAASTGAVASALTVGATQTGLVRMRSKAAFCLTACVPLEPYFLIKIPALSVG